MQRFTSWFFLIGVALGGYVFAQSLPLVATSPPETIVSRSGTVGLVILINTASKTLYSIILVIGVAFILYAAFSIITSGGDEARFKKGKAILKNTILGVIIAIMAVSIVLVILSVFDAAEGNTPSSGFINNQTYAFLNNRRIF